MLSREERRMVCKNSGCRPVKVGGRLLPNASTKIGILSSIFMLCFFSTTHFAHAWNPSSPTSQKTMQASMSSNCDGYPPVTLIGENPDRRQIFASIGSALVSSSAILLNPGNGFASDDKADPATPTGLLTVDNVGEWLHPIPTFAIVDPQGVPYMVVGEDAKVTGYFFTTYPEAARVLQLAKTSADKAIKRAKKEGQDMEEIGENPWKTARISSVPLDLAATLVYKSSRTKGLYFKVAPAEEDVEDALKVTGDKDLAEGKVPLFYYEDFKVNDKSPLFFRKKELEQAWRHENPKQDIPKLLVTELFSVVKELVKPGGADDDLRNLVLSSPKESEKKKIECLKKSGNEAPFVIGQRIIVL